MKKITKNILYGLVIALLFASSVKASEVNNYENEYDSMYRYNALENKISFMDLANNSQANSLKEKSPIISKQEDSITKNLQEVVPQLESSKTQASPITDSIKNIIGWFMFSL